MMKWKWMKMNNRNAYLFDFSFESLMNTFYQYIVKEDFRGMAVVDRKTGEKIYDDRFADIVKFCHAWVGATMNNRSRDIPDENKASKRDLEYAFNESAYETYIEVMSSMEQQLLKNGQIDVSKVVDDSKNVKYKYADSIARGLFSSGDYAQRIEKYIKAAVPENDYSFTGVRNMFYKYKVSTDQNGNDFAENRITGEKTYDSDIVNKAAFSAAWVGAVQHQLEVSYSPDMHAITANELDYVFSEKSEVAYNAIMDSIKNQLLTVGGIDCSQVVRDVGAVTDLHGHSEPSYIARCLFSNNKSLKRVDAWARKIVPNTLPKTKNIGLNDMLLDQVGNYEYSETVHIAAKKK